MMNYQQKMDKNNINKININKINNNNINNNNINKKSKSKSLNHLVKKDSLISIKILEKMMDL